MPGHGDKLSRKQEQAIAALLVEPTIDSAAQKAAIGLTTLKNWLKLPVFLGAYRAARRQVVEGALGQLQRATGEAVAALKRNLKCNQPGNEIRAAVAILDHAVKAVEVLDLVEQLADLKQQVEGLTHAHRNDAPGSGPIAGRRGPADGGGEPDTGPSPGGPGPNSDGSRDGAGPMASEPVAVEFEEAPAPLFKTGG
jgi:hypothetical protein